MCFNANMELLQIPALCIMPFAVIILKKNNLFFPFFFFMRICRYVIIIESNSVLTFWPFNHYQNASFNFLCYTQTYTNLTHALTGLVFWQERCIFACPHTLTRTFFYQKLRGWCLLCCSVIDRMPRISVTEWEEGHILCIAMCPGRVGMPGGVGTLVPLAPIGVGYEYRWL